MQVMRRTIVALGAVAAILAVTGCGGLGVNIGSGTSRGGANVDHVNIQVQSGVNIPNVLNGHTILMQAIARYYYGGQDYISTTQGAQWGVLDHTAGICTGKPYACTAPAAGFTGNILLLNGDCVTPYLNTVTQNVCVLGASTGTAGLTATVSGVKGQVTVTVQ